MGTGEGFALEMDRACGTGGGGGVVVEELLGSSGGRRAGVFFPSSSPATDAGRGWWREKATAPAPLGSARLGADGFWWWRRPGVGIRRLLLGNIDRLLGEERDGGDWIPLFLDGCWISLARGFVSVSAL